jgi:hypothetical protein
MAWAISASYAQTGFTICFEKFGLALYVFEAARFSMVREIIRALGRCCSVAESYLKTEIETRLVSAQVTIENQYYRFEGAYQFFRTRAREAYSTPPAKPVTNKTRFGEVTTWDKYRPKKEGGYLASAMLDAYFSKLEHLLVLMSAFSNLDFENGGLRRFVGDFWSDKFKALFDVQSDKHAKRIYDDLRNIKEELRNPASHGGFLKNGESFLFHSEAGALPVMLTRSNVDFEFRITPVPPSTFDQVCELLDRADTFLKNSSLAEGFAFAVAGLDVAFDAKSRQEFRRAAQSDDFEAFLNRRAYIQDMHANMDY